MPRIGSLCYRHCIAGDPFVSQPAAERPCAPAYRFGAFVMTMQAYIVWGLVASLLIVAILLGRGVRRRQHSIAKTGRRAVRLQQQLDWDRQHEDPSKAP